MNDSATNPSHDFILKAIKSSNINALRIALYHQTKDAALIDIPIEKIPMRGGAFTNYSVPKEYREIIREKAFNYLTNHPEPVDDPNKQEAGLLMKLFSGDVPTQAEVDYGYEDLGFDPLARSALWKDKPNEEAIKNFEVLIVGAGINGICMAVQLDRLGIPYSIVERMDGIGGTWHLNDYPGARVDISTFLYQFKFEKNYPWKSFFATQPELKEYLEYIVDKYSIREKINLNTAVKTANWCEESKTWKVVLQTSDNATVEKSVNSIISASGLFSTPNLPDIAGIESFEGKMFHTTNWDHDYDFTDKKIALIGTGSTGTQLMPHLAERAEKLTVFQRSANWITPSIGYKDKVIPEQQWLLENMPGYWNWFIYSSSIAEIQIQPLQVTDHDWQEKGGVVNEKNQMLANALIDFIRDKMGHRYDLFIKLLPNHPPVARRLVIDGGFYDALLRENVELLTDGIREIVPGGIITKDGKFHEFDLIVLGAGFKVSKYLYPVNYVGRNGATLDRYWKEDGARAYMSMCLPEFPNFFMLYGPNGQGRAGGFHSWSEILGRYVGNLIATTIENNALSVEVKRSAYDEYNRSMDEEMKKLLWEEQGQSGYYTNEKGRSGLNMPWEMHQFYEMIHSPEEMENFTLCYK